MRQGLILVTVLMGAGIGLGVSSHDAEAAPLPAAASPVVASALVVEAGWRRNWRRYGPTVVIPDADVDVDVDVDEEATSPARHLPWFSSCPFVPRAAASIATGTDALRRCALPRSLSRTEITGLVTPDLRRRLAGNDRARPRSGIDAGDAAEIAQDRRDLIVGELNLRHVAVLGAHTFGEALLQLVDGIFEIDLPQRRRLRQWTCAGCFEGMTPAAIRFENGLAFIRRGVQPPTQPTPQAPAARDNSARSGEVLSCSHSPPRKGPRLGIRGAVRHQRAQRVMVIDDRL